ncbi:hypothetical protein JKA74_14015 [Marivirga sp. S37H4]|uniref:Tail specific protease domain-containing protein n=1 Tax=Marivirga aurantiaca TaxID=2802615 RepID=A0A935C9G3_9BACT|nr:S41 family peptidase [Marivirga aurantiaca]MBK6266156.1 hypothetical protein [Marivirga aurantiaca]
MKKNLRFLTVILLALSLNSCGLFLQNTGVKNYSIKDQPGKALNDYQYDFIYLTKLLKEGFPELESIFPEQERIKLEKEIIVLLANKELQDIDFVLQARRYLSNVHNQHTNFYLKSDIETVYPFIVHTSYNRWHLLNLHKEQDSSHIGKEIITINGLEVEELEKRLMNYTFGENKINRQHEINRTQMYNKPVFLQETGLITKLTETIQITFSDSSSVVLAPLKGDEEFKLYEIHLPRNELTQKQKATYAYQVFPDQNLGYLQFNNCHDKIDIIDGIKSYVKPWLQPLAQAYVKKQFKKDEPNKRLASFYNPKYPVFKDFVWELVDSLNQNNIPDLVIDLRNNPGGNLTLGIQMIYFLTDRTDLRDFTEYTWPSDIYKSYFPEEYKNLQKAYPEGFPENQLVNKQVENDFFHEITAPQSDYYIPANRPVYKGKIHVLANYGTGSAAAMLTTLLQDNNIATVIGTSVGNNPTGATTYTPMKLPKTKAHVSIATTFKVRPDKTASKIQLPHHWVEYTIKDLLTGNDPYWEKVKELTGSGK